MDKRMSWEGRRIVDSRCIVGYHDCRCSPSNYVSVREGRRMKCPFATGMISVVVVCE